MIHITMQGDKNMVLPGDWDEDSEEARAEDREEDLEDREEWLDIVEDEYIAQGDISASETVDGHEALPELEDEDSFEDELDDILDEDEL
jgi:hypothetical protein